MSPSDAPTGALRYACSLFSIGDAAARGVPDVL